LDVPIVFSMVLYPAASGFLGGRARVTGASLDVPFDVQLGYLQRLLPRARRIGVLYSPEETGSVIAAARPAAERYGLELISEEVDEPSRAPLVLDSLMQKVDALWTVADSGVFTPQTTPTLLLAALRHRMPLIGLSPGHVRSGALAALVVDYEEVGRQTAELVVRVLEAPSSEVPVTAPRRVTLALNLKTAELLGLQIPKELLEEARIVVR
jgi:putative ABC transport system substrate-binding protein